jgi:hypothetical protein
MRAPQLASNVGHVLTAAVDDQPVTVTPVSQQ